MRHVRSLWRVAISARSISGVRCSPCSAASRAESVMVSACSEVSLAAVNARAMASVSNTERCYDGADVAERLARATRPRYEGPRGAPIPACSWPVSLVRWNPMQNDGRNEGNKRQLSQKAAYYQWVTRYPCRSSTLLSRAARRRRGRCHRPGVSLPASGRSGSCRPNWRRRCRPAPRRTAGHQPHS